MDEFDKKAEEARKYETQKQELQKCLDIWNRKVNNNINEIAQEFDNFFSSKRDFKIELPRNSKGIFTRRPSEGDSYIRATIGKNLKIELKFSDAGHYVLHVNSIPIKDSVLTIERAGYMKNIYNKAYSKH